MATNGNNLGGKKGQIFECKNCNFICCKKYSWDRHLTTRKHLDATNDNIISTKRADIFKCNICNKEYKDRTGLWRHKKNAKIIIFL